MIMYRRLELTLLISRVNMVLENLWTRLACIMGVENYKYYKSLPSCCIFVMNYGLILKIYNSNDNIPDVQENSPANPKSCQEAITYIESLVFPNSDHIGNLQPGKWGTKVCVLSLKFL